MCIHVLTLKFNKVVYLKIHKLKYFEKKQNKIEYKSIFAKVALACKYMHTCSGESLKDDGQKQANKFLGGGGTWVIFILFPFHTFFLKFWTNIIGIIKHF